MNFLLDLTQPLVLALILFIALLVASLTVVGRPWRSSRSELADRLRIGSAVVRYDFWLEMHGVSRRRRRGLREELRTNLDDAAEQVGAAEATRKLPQQPTSDG